MAFLEWRDKMSVGNDYMDADHKELLEFLNDLHDMMSGIPDPESIIRLLDRLVTFAEYHFQTEEKLLRLCRYPRFEDHKKQHQDLMEQLLEIRSAYIKEPTKGRLVEAFDFLSNWLMRHILREDMAYKPFIEKKSHPG